MTAQKIILTGIKPTGTPHLGNYLGMLRPALELEKKPGHRCFYFIADLHALNGIQNPKDLQQYTLEVAATWLACGLDPARAVFYRQSDILEIPYIAQLLAPAAPKSLMNQAHAYKAIVAQNRDAGHVDLDDGVNMGLYTYPILMGADILAFQTDAVPVGRDQAQHIDITRDLARRFNVRYGEVFRMPELIIREEVQTIPGLDGRKMSKSYDNTIPLFIPSKQLQKLINRIQTDSTPPEAPKDPNNSVLFDLYRHFATPEQVEVIRQRYQQGIGWGEMKKELFLVVDQHLTPMRERYEAFMKNPAELHRLFEEGAKQARAIAQETLHQARKAVGLVS